MNKKQIAIKVGVGGGILILVLLAVLLLPKVDWARMPGVETLAQNAPPWLAQYLQPKEAESEPEQIEASLGRGDELALLMMEMPAYDPAWARMTVADLGEGGRFEYVIDASIKNCIDLIEEPNPQAFMVTVAGPILTTTCAGTDAEGALHVITQVWVYCERCGSYQPVWVNEVGEV